MSVGRAVHRAVVVLLLVGGGMLPPARAGSVADVSAQQTELQTALAEFDEAQRLLAGRPDRAKALFVSAAQRMEGLLSAGANSGALEYNIGNCYLQAGDIGRSVLHYRRAERLIPGDPLLLDNLSVAKSRCLTTIQSSRGSRVLRSLFFWHFDTSARGRAWAALAAYLTLWGCLAMRLWVPRRAVAVVAVVAGLTATAAGGSLATERWLDRRMPRGVILAMDVTVYKGPGTSYQRQFEQPLQPGVEFTLRAARGAWWNIELPDGKLGWVEGGAAALVPPAALSPGTAEPGGVLRLQG
ncbi:MAG: SH3 domain-containing protein [Planctomycetes bacterium]|nr:SH3 domain-containing protein [Planctomycetota bacterium]